MSVLLVYAIKSVVQPQQYSCLLKKRSAVLLAFGHTFVKLRSPCTSRQEEHQLPRNRHCMITCNLLRAFKKTVNPEVPLLLVMLSQTRVGSLDIRVSP